MVLITISSHKILGQIKKHKPPFKNIWNTDAVQVPNVPYHKTVFLVALNDTIQPEQSEKYEFSHYKKMLP